MKHFAGRAHHATEMRTQLRQFRRRVTESASTYSPAKGDKHVAHVSRVARENAILPRCSESSAPTCQCNKVNAESIAIKLFLRAPRERENFSRGPAHLHWSSMSRMKPVSDSSLGFEALLIREGHARRSSMLSLQRTMPLGRRCKCSALGAPAPFWSVGVCDEVMT